MSERDEKRGADFVEHGIGSEDEFPNYERGLLSPAPSIKTTTASRSQSLQSKSESCNETLTLVNRNRPQKFVRFDRVAPMNHNGVPGEVLVNGFASPITER